MANVLTAWLEAFTEASPVRKLWLTLLAGLPVAALVAAYIWLHQPPYRVLFSRLSDQSGGEVMAALDQMDIAYRLSETDGAIQVPANQLYSARFKLAARGLPKTDTQGFERSESAPTFGLSQFQEQLHYQHALENELVRSVQTLDAVAAARVHLAMPKVSPFLRDPPPVTAAVLVQLKPQQSLSNEQVTAIQRLVAASVPRLNPSDVSVLDPQGQLLGVVGTGPEARRAAVEADLVQRVMQVLGAWLGPDKFKVHVTTTLAEDGSLRHLNAAVILAPGTRPEIIDKAGSLTREALGFDAARGDSLSVFALPAATVATVMPGASTRVAATPQLPAPTPLMWMLLLGGSTALLLIWLGWRARRRSQPALEEIANESEHFETLLQRARRQTLDNPRITADVIRMWMRT